MGLIISTVFVLTLLSMQGVAQARGCLIFAVTSVSVTDIHGGASEKMDKNSYHAEQRCGDIRIIVGRAHVIFEENGEPNSVDVLGPHYALPMEMRADDASNGQRSAETSSFRDLIQSVRDMLNGFERRRDGVVKGAAENAAVAAMPVGQIAAPNGDLRIDLPLGPGDTAPSITLMDSKGRIVARPKPGNQVFISHSAMKIGEIYVWRLGTGVDAPKGRFTVDDPSKLAAQEDSFAREAQHLPTPEMRTLEVAMKLRDAGYHDRARQILVKMLSGSSTEAQ